MDKDKVIAKYSVIFERAGFGEYALDFSFVRPEVIEAMGEALLALERKTGKPLTEDDSD